MTHKRRIYLINPRFQLKFSLFISILIVGVMLIYPYTLYQIIERLISQSELQASLLESKREALMITLVAWQFGYTLLVFIVCIFFSHKIAGPLFKLNKHLNKITRNEEVETIAFRKGDYFHEIADSFNEAVTTIQTGREQDFKQLEVIKMYLNNLSMVVPEDKKIVLSEINGKLQEILQRYQ